MKNSLRISSIMLIAFTALIINGCSKGKDGAPGTDGAAGNANVTSHTYSVSTWNSNSSMWYAGLSVPELTSSNVNTASVQVYFSNVSGLWSSVPFTQTGTVDYFMQYVYAANTVEIDWLYNGISGIGSSPNSYYSATSMFKVVIIPPALIKQNPDLDYNDYNKVKKAFNLKD